RNYDAIEKVYGHHKKFEMYFGNYTSPAKIVVIAPGNWPSGEAAQEYRGIQLMLKEAHLQYDIIEDGQIANLPAEIKKYKLIILPGTTNLDDDAIQVLSDAIANGTHIIATNKTLANNA